MNETFPTVQQGWPDRREFRSKILSFCPFVRHIGEEVTKIWKHQFSPRVILGSHRYNDILVTVCTVPAADTASAVVFHGDAERQEKMQLKFGSLCEAFVDVQDRSMNTNETTTQPQQPHWIHTLGLSLYLSQCTLYNASSSSSSSSSSSTEATDATTMKHDEFPRELFTSFQQEVLALSTFPLSFLDQDHDEMFRVDQVNLWMNIGSTISSLHYDNYNNMLVVIEGTKQVHLISPEVTSKLNPFAATSISANHAHISHVTDLLDSGILSTTEVMTVTLHEGEVLFIPEGYWHEVHSDACTVALNFWFHGPIAQLLLKNSAMLPYILRTCVHGMTTTTTTMTKSKHDLSMNTWDDDDAFATFMKQLHESFIMVSSSNQDDVGHKRGRKEQNHGNDMSLLEATFVNTSLSTMMRLWPTFVSLHPQIFGDILLSLSPQGANCLLSTWEQEPSNHDSMTTTTETSFFATLFRPCGERTPQIRQYLIRQSDTYVKQITLKAVHDILGN